MAYNNSSSLQKPTDGSNPPINSPSNNSNTATENNTPGVGVPVMTSNNPPVIISTSMPSQPPQLEYHIREFYFAIFALMVVIAGVIMWGVVKYPRIGAILLAIGAVLLLGIVFFTYYTIRRERYRMQLQIYQQQMQTQV